MKIGRWIVGAAILGGAAWGSLSLRRDHSTPHATPQVPVAPAVAADTTARAPTGIRVRVQVANGTTTRGLARRATRWLRTRGFDVVETGGWPQRVDSTLVLDRSGHPDWARRAARAMGGARVEARPDSSRYLDLTIVIGRAWRAPAETLDP